MTRATQSTPPAALLAGLLALCLLSLSPCAGAADLDNYYQDPPPRRATGGIADCAAPVVRALTPDEARREAHQRVERGTSCFLAGTCPAGGDYKDDAAVNERVAAAIGADPRFTGASIWVTTLRKFVTVQGCLVDEAQGRQLEQFVRAIPGVRLVWQEARVAGRPPR